MKQFLINRAGLQVKIKNIKTGFIAILLTLSMVSFSNAQGTVCSLKRGNAVKHSLIEPAATASFKATLRVDGKVILNWTSSPEADNSHFIMQRSLDGVEFVDAALLFATEGSGYSRINYHYADNINMIKSPKVYYRIKMVDNSGRATYTAPVKVGLEKNGAGKSAMYPSI